MKGKIKVCILRDNKYMIKKCLREHINIYKIEKKENKVIYTIDFEDYKKIRDYVNMESYTGFNFLKYKLRLNIHFIIALFSTILIFFFLSNVVVRVEVIHSNSEVRDLVYESLKEQGIHSFMLKKSFNDLQEIKTKILNNNEDTLEWIEIFDNGMKYTIRVEERIITNPESSPPYCDIVSTKDAVILGIETAAGQQVVNVNDYVKKGTTLISGSVIYNDEIKNYVCADGTIYGNTWYTVNISIPYVKEEKKYSGKTSHNLSILVGSKILSLFKVHYDTFETEHKELFSIKNITFYYDTNKEYSVNTKTMTKEEALNEALNISQEKLLVSLDDDSTIINQKVLQTNYYDSIIELEVFYSVNEVISTTIIKDIEEEKEEIASELTE